MTNLRVAIQMDPIDSIDIIGDTSFRLALEAQKRGHIVYFYRPEDLSWEEGVVSAKVRSIILQDVVGNHAKIVKIIVGQINFLTGTSVTCTPRYNSGAVG